MERSKANGRAKKDLRNRGYRFCTCKWFYWWGEIV